MHLHRFIATIPDFPKPGIDFKDVSPLLQHPPAFKYAIARMQKRWNGEIDTIAALDARGFLFGAALAASMEVPLVMIRKVGKLPGPVFQASYGLEYGSGTIEVQQDAIAPGARVLVVDDLLATGGTAAAASHLIEKAGGVVAGYAFVVELLGLGGRSALRNGPLQSLITY